MDKQTARQEVQRCQSHGFEVIPLYANSKMQMGTGTKKALADEVLKRIEQAEAQGVNLALYPTGKVMVMDVDVKDGAKGQESYEALCQRFPELGVLRTPKVTTPSGGFHLYFKVPNGFKLRGRIVEGYAGIDFLHDNNYAVCPPSTYGGKPYAWVTAPEDCSLAALPTGLCEFLQTSPADTDRPRQSIAEQLQDVPVGSRHATLLSVAGKLAHQGLSYEDTLAATSLMAAGLGKNESEAVAIVDYVYDREEDNKSLCSASLASLPPIGGDAGRKAAVVGVNAYSLKDCLTRSAPPTPWLVQGVLPEAGAGIFAGLGYIGKSFVLMDLGLEVSRGGVWLGSYQTQRRPVIYVDQENSHGEISRRLKKLARGKGIAPDNDLDLTIVTADYLPLDQPHGSEALRNLLKDKSGALVIVDSLIRVFTGDENSARDMARLSQNLLRMSREFNCFVLLADHLGKNASHGHGANLRGTTEKFAFCDVVFECERTGDGNLRLRNTKQRAGQPMEPLELRLRDADEQTTLLEVVEDALFQEAPVDRDEELRQFILDFLGRNDDTARPHIVDAARARGFGKNKVDAALDALCPSHLVLDNRLNRATGRWTHYYRLAKKGEQVDLSFVGEPAMT
jgi:hypothetical protein